MLRLREEKKLVSLFFNQRRKGRGDAFSFTSTDMFDQREVILAKDEGGEELTSFSSHILEGGRGRHPPLLSSIAIKRKRRSQEKSSTYP